MGGQESRLYIDNYGRHECSDKWKQKVLLGTGSVGKTYELCCKGHCNYVMKVVTFGTSHGEVNMARFKKEIQIHKKMASIGVSPQIYDAWKAGSHGFIVMDRLAYTLENKIDRGEFTNIGELYDLIKLMHDNGVIHKDVHAGNIMYDLNDRPYIIDHGTSIYTPEQEVIADYLKKHDYIKLKQSIASRQQ